MLSDFERGIVRAIEVANGICRLKSLLNPRLNCRMLLLTSSIPPPYEKKWLTHHTPWGGFFLLRLVVDLVVDIQSLDLFKQLRDLFF